MNINKKFDIISTIAISALIREAALHPKPGLVDPYDNGSHKDMDFKLLVKSAKSFKEGFVNYLKTGYYDELEPKEMLFKIRTLGLEAEKSMFLATNNINTHKGANFSFGVFLCALGHFIKQYNNRFTPETILLIFDFIKKMTHNLVSDDFKNIKSKKKLTYGEKLYLKYNIGGIRQEAQYGYPLITKLALPRLLMLKKQNLSNSQIYIDILFNLMANTEDSNIISRGGIESLEYVKTTARNFIDQGSVLNTNYIYIIQDINNDFKSKNLSPGGSADLLALTIFIDKLIRPI